MSRALADDLQKVESTEDNPKLSKTFRKVICQAILSCFIFNHDLTIATMEQLGFTSIFFAELFSDKHMYTTPYERKLFIFALSKLIFKSSQNY